MFKPVVAIVFALGLSCASVAVSAQGPIHANPAFKSFDVGTMNVSVLRAGRLAIPNDGSVFGLNARPSAVAEVLKRHGLQTKTIYLDIDVLLVRSGGRLVLIDSGYGVKQHSVLGESLALRHVSPAEVTDVLITHAHPDHVGGLVDESGKPAFPNATIRMSASEWRFMQDQSDSRDIAAAIRSKVEAFAPGELVLPGIRSRPAYGHTPGHVMYELGYGGARLLDIGDVAHSSIVSLARPDWAIAWDQDKGLGARERRRELDTLAASHERMFAVHFPYPGVGFIDGAGSVFSFRPSLPSKATPGT